MFLLLSLSTRWHSVICVVAPLFNRVMWLVLQSDFFITQLLIVLCLHKHPCTYTHIIYYVSHLINVTWSGDGSDYHN